MLRPSFYNSKKFSKNPSKKLAKLKTCVFYIVGGEIRERCNKFLFAVGISNSGSKYVYSKSLHNGISTVTLNKSPSISMLNLPFCRLVKL